MLVQDQAVFARGEALGVPAWTCCEVSVCLECTEREREIAHTNSQQPGGWRRRCGGSGGWP